MKAPSHEAGVTRRAAFAPSDFIRDIVAKHVAEGKYPRIQTRFPPEPNGYLHIGHAKSICLNFGIARECGGICNLRMDDTNPTKEAVEYVESIRKDVEWLIGGWATDNYGLKPTGKLPEAQTVNGKPDAHLPAVVGKTHEDRTLEPFYASDYFDQIYEYAVTLIKKGKAYVCDLSPADTDAYRGAPDRPGKESPWRNRSIKESLDLFTRMKNGDFPDGARTLRAKIDMAAPNVWLRDPLLYRIRHASHHHTGDKWCIYPMYDFAHCLSDYIEAITHSICTLEFEVHRRLYDWILESLDLPRPLPHQYEFAKLIPTYMIVSKRKLIALVNEKVVTGWDDPRLPTISGMRRRGITAEALRNFAIGVGVTKYISQTDIAVFEHAIRDDLNKRAPRRLAVLRPIKVIITNYPEGKVEELDAVNNPEDENAGKRKIPFSRELFIERDDFAEVPPPKYFRLKPGGEVRLKYAYIIKCEEVVKDAAGNITELRCTADLESKTGGATSARKIKGTIHWVSAMHAVDAEVRLYDRLFTVPDPEAMGDFRQFLNPHSLEIVTAKCELSMVGAVPADQYQLERIGYFCVDSDGTPGKLVFNRTIALQDPWAKKQKGAIIGGSEADPDAYAVQPANRDRGMMRLDEITVKGKPVKVRGALVGDVVVVVRGKWIKRAVVKDEWWLKTEAVVDAGKFVERVRNSGQAADLFTFVQRPPDTQPRYNYHIEWDNVAAIPITSFADWWQKQITTDVRQNIKKAWKSNVIIKPVPLDDELIRGIASIYNETAMRQGKKFYHYGEDFETVKKLNSTYSDQTSFIGAYFEDELIGFIQLNWMGPIADIKQILSKNQYYDKKPGNALIAKAVELCAKRGVSHLLYGKLHYYGNREDDTLIEFKRRNGFRQAPVPRYYVPLTLKGWLVIKTRLHLEPKHLIPENVLRWLLGVRARWFATRMFQSRARSKSAGSEGQPGTAAPI